MSGCSFCGTGVEKVKRLIVNSDEVNPKAICDKCIKSFKREIALSLLHDSPKVKIIDMPKSPNQAG